VEYAGEANIDRDNDVVQVSEIHGSSALEETPPPSAVIFFSNRSVDGAFLNAIPFGIGVRPYPCIAVRSVAAELQIALSRPDLIPTRIIAASKQPTAEVVVATTSAGGASTSAMPNSSELPGSHGRSLSWALMVT
jgi:hypothetical protein